MRLWDSALNEQIYLGDDDFVARMQIQVTHSCASSKDMPKAQRSAPQDLTHWLRVCENRKEALRRAHVEKSGISMTALAGELGLSVARISQLISRAKASRFADTAPSLTASWSPLAGLVWR